jgi:predicted dehydrogenase
MQSVETGRKIRMGFIGVGNRGTQLLERFMANPKAEIVALCDVYEPYLRRDRSAVHPTYLGSGIPVPKMGEEFSGDVARYTDFRELLARKDIDAVCIATPDHWHAIQTVMAFQAGKDVFVEKPLTVTVEEGRRMVDAERQTGRIGAVCLNRRGSTVFRKLADLVQDGAIGDVVMGCARRISSMYPDGIGNCEPADPPADFDWDMWLGPRPARPYQFNIAPYHFRWWKDYSSQMGNWGVHYLDVIRWLMGETAPVSVWASGGNLVLKDDRTIPDTLITGFQFASGRIAQFEVIESCGGQGIQGGEIEMRGSKGMLLASQDAYRIVPAPRGQFQTWDTLLEPQEFSIKGDRTFGDLGIREDSTAILIDDFLDCVSTRRKPLCTLEDGHRSTTFAHLANIALEVGGRLEWDPEAERFVNCDAANEKLHYTYRKPWML